MDRRACTVMGREGTGRESVLQKPHTALAGPRAREAHAKEEVHHKNKQLRVAFFRRHITVNNVSFVNNDVAGRGEKALAKTGRTPRR